MGITKSQVFNNQQNQIAEFAKAFAHPARVAIIQHLLKHQNCICGDLVDVLPLSQSTISQHLKELKRIGIIVGEIEGPRVCYCVNEDKWNQAQKMLDELFAAHPACNA